MTDYDSNNGAWVSMFGNNQNDTFLDLKMTWLKNLIVDYKGSGCATEIKMTNCNWISNTIELGNGATRSPAQWRARHGRIVRDTTRQVGSVLSSLADGNLYVWPTGSTAAPSLMSLRDGYNIVRNNWGVVLDPGTQPSLLTPLSTKLRIGLYTGALDWKGYPENENPPSINHNWMNCGKCMVGGNHAVVVVKTNVDPYNTYKPEDCRVATADTGRSDRNQSVDVADLTSNAVRTDFSTGVPGADYNKVPHRLKAVENGFASNEIEVGPQGWDPSFYGSQG
jgi:hypothetical protein